MKKKETILTIICTLFIVLWVYTALSKAADIEVFQLQLSRQPAPISSLAPLLSWILPMVELATAGLLMFHKSRRAGLHLSFLLMLAFTAYVALAVIGYWEDIPCSCGGVLNQLSWKDHLWFNLFFLILAVIGNLVEKHSRRSKHQGGNLQQAASAGRPA